MTTTEPARTADPATRIGALGIVPVVELRSADEAAPLVEALAEGGLPIAEITLRTEAGLAAIGMLRDAYPEVLVGAGTVRTEEQAHRVIDAGAEFVVSPGLDPAVVEICRGAEVLAVPGVCTPTEVIAAVRAGVQTVKFFPAQAMGGIAFLKALAPPFRDVSFVPTGGIDATNLRDYLELPGVVACGGSWLVAPKLLAEGRFDRVRELTREAVGIVRDTRGHD